MWTRFYGLMKLVFTFGEQTRKNTDKIEELREDVKQLTRGIERMAYEIQRLRDDFDHFKDNERNEREKMALRLEVDMLRFERRLSSGKSDDAGDN